MTNNQKLLERIEKDMHDLEEQVKTMTPLDVFNNSYKFACEQEIYGAIDFACDDTYTGNEDYAEGFENMERLIDYKGNLLAYLTDEYTNFRHPEYYNIFGGYEDTLNIIQIIIDECMGEYDND